MRIFNLFSVAVLGLSFVNICQPICAQNLASQPLAPHHSATRHQPLVVLLKSDNCTVCKKIAPLLGRLHKTYQQRSQWVTLDVSNRKTLAQAEKQVKALGIEAFFEKYGNHTGLVAVIDPQSKKILSLLIGEDKPEKYQAALDQAIKVLNP